jgi:hypothetical protein
MRYQCLSSYRIHPNGLCKPGSQDQNKLKATRRYCKAKTTKIATFNLSTVLAAEIVLVIDDCVAQSRKLALETHSYATQAGTSGNPTRIRGANLVYPNRNGVRRNLRYVPAPS